MRQWRGQISIEDHKAFVLISYRPAGTPRGTWRGKFETLSPDIKQLLLRGFTGGPGEYATSMGRIVLTGDVSFQGSGPLQLPDEAG